MHISNILSGYPGFIEHRLGNRFFKYKDIRELLKQLPFEFEVSVAGKSYEGRDLHLVKWGDGPVKVFLWSQMHGDEATGTMALFDLFNFLTDTSFSEISEQLKSSCTLYFLPMVNPDGAERFTRRNAQEIDINRDFNKTSSPEAAILKQVRTAIDPDFGFNLHDQSTLWSVKKTGKPATLSFLAPAFDEALTVNDIRKNAMQIIADIHQTLVPLLPVQIGLFDDEYEGRAFGDNFQAAGTSTILIEAGGLHGDAEKQEIRKYFFLSILTGLLSINKENYLAQDLKNYYSIPPNNKEIFHILIKDIQLKSTLSSIGLSYEEEPAEDALSTQKVYEVKDFGDLNHLHAYQTYEGNMLEIEGDIKIYKKAHFDLQKNGEIILSFKNGIIQSKQ